jgi:hydrogenase maturation protein HypF
MAEDPCRTRGSAGTIGRAERVAAALGAGDVIAAGDATATMGTTSFAGDAMTERRFITVSGIVQGVGFRPFVHRLAVQSGLHGSVRNAAGDVRIDVEGETVGVERFLNELSRKHPPLAQVTQISWEPAPIGGARGFHIDPSDADQTGPIWVSPDVATCPDCLAEFSNPADRRFGHPFLNCTNCGPRLTIVTGAPYDRQRTTMASFPMCDACRTEFEDSQNRRFHAQPTACPACGPRLDVCDAAGASLHAADPLARFAEAICAGRIGAIKGLGGYHLCCDARNEAAIEELRRRKHREERPFAIMVPDVATAEALCEISAAEHKLLTSWRSPIVLLQKRPSAEASVAEAVAPGSPCLGVMLPYTPVHHRLLHEVSGIPLVMTSGNRSDEPIAIQDNDAFQRLQGIADLFLVHDRPIVVRCDDSVTRVVGRSELPARRSRGYAPQPIDLPVCCRQPILATGGHLKGTFALARGSEAILSHHLGDLDHPDACRAFWKDISLYQQLFVVHPEIIAHDLHPDYASTRYARARAEADDRLRLVGVQHHHAHMASCMAENGLDQPVIGVTFDGSGWGTDGTVWGGEFLVGDLRGFRRAAHLRTVGLPGGDRAVREPWRMAAAHLHDAACSTDILAERVRPGDLRIIETMLQRSVSCPRTSSMGRLFDAVAALAGLRTHVCYEGQAAIELEWLAGATDEFDPGDRYPWELSPSPHSDDGPLSIDTRPLIRAVVEDVRTQSAPRDIARRFHATVADIVVRVCSQIRKRTGINEVVLSGGVFMNALLTLTAESRLKLDGFIVHRHRLVPPNDGGLSLGQVAVAAALARAADDRLRTLQRQPVGVAASTSDGSVLSGENGTATAGEC